MATSDDLLLISRHGCVRANAVVSAMCGRYCHRASNCWWTVRVVTMISLQSGHDYFDAFNISLRSPARNLPPNHHSVRKWVHLLIGTFENLFVQRWNLANAEGVAAWSNSIRCL